MNRKDFEKYLQDNKINCDAESFYAYMSLLQEWNEKINLTALTSEEDVLEKHFVDSLIIHKYLGTSKTVCDVGTGAGFPGVVLAMINKDIKVTLVEPIKKRCVFLNELITELKLNNVEVVNKRAEDFASTNRESYDFVCARAVANLQILSELCLPLVKVDGIFLAMKGGNASQEIEDSQKAIDLLGGKIEFINEDKLPNQDLRNNILIRKIKKTPSKYPRVFAKIKKNPL